MPRPAASILREALRISKTGQLIGSSMAGYIIDALDALNSALDFLTETIDLAKATKTFNFTFAPNLVTAGAGNIVTAAANPLPIDYLRVQTSGGSTGAQRSTKWYLNGVPYDMIEIDLTEWDDQVQQAGIQSYPYYCAKDMSGGSILFNFQGDLNSATNVVNNVATSNPLLGTSTPGVPSGLAPGMSLAGGIGATTPIVPGTTIVAVNSAANQITLSVPPTYLNGSPGTAWSGQAVQASLMAGYPANLLIYPPPSGAFNAMIRYQCYMPPLTQAQVNGGAYAWYPDDTSLVDLVAKRLMALADDQRMGEYVALTRQLVGEYRRHEGDRANRAQTVLMDSRSFGKDFSNLRNTKTIGW
jgi:hypothetical protein